jgi:DNA processing protein
MKSDLNQNLSDYERQIILGLFLITKFGFKRITKLFEIYKDWNKIWNLNYQDLKKINLSHNLVETFLKNRNKTNLEEIWNTYVNQNIKIITYFDENYPYLLKETFSPPLVLFAQGNIDILNRKNLLSVVGSRKHSSYGKSTVEKFIKKIAEQNITIVSGLAIGIDTLAHIESLDTSGSTIAILGSPINEIYPAKNFQLAQKIKEKGLILSEFPLGSKIAKENFPRRNRVIAGLSQATLIIEAQEKSGALITGNYALHENKELLAIPGSIFQNTCQGTNNLIKQGAKLVNNISDILEIYNLQNISEIEKKKINFQNKEQEIIYQIILKESCSIDKIAIYSRLKISIIISCLTQMELKGIIKNIGNQTYQIN